MREGKEKDILDEIHKSLADLKHRIMKLNIQRLSFLIALSSLLITAAFSFYNLDISNRALDISTDAYEATKPFQEPILDIEDTKIIYNISDYSENKIIAFNMDFNITNRGKGIAEELTIRFFFSTFNNPSSLMEGVNLSYANPIYPSITVDHTISFNIIGTFADKVFSGENWAIIIRFEYLDHVTNKNLNLTCWGKSHIGTDRLIFQTIEDKNLFLPYYNELL